MILYNFACFIFRIWLYPVCRMKVAGSHYLPERGGGLVLANHVSYADPPVLGAALKRKVHFMAKQELFDVPIFGPLLKYTGAFPVKRGTADRWALRRAADLLREGHVVAIFPEGGRSRDGDLQPAELGAALIALQSDVPVLPTGLIGTADLLPPGSTSIRINPIKVVIGPPLDLEDLKGRKHDRAVLEETGRRIMAGIALAIREGLED